MAKQRSTAGTRRFSEAWNEFARDVDLAALDLDPAELFSDLREKRDGDVRLPPSRKHTSLRGRGRT